MILFYPRGSASPTAGAAALPLDIRDAEAVLEAANGGVSLPAANGDTCTLAQWTMYLSGANTPPAAPLSARPARPVDSATSTRTLASPTSARSSTSAGQAEFYNSCAAPDGTPQFGQTHSPVIN